MVKYFRKRFWQKALYQMSLDETLERIKNGEENLELSKRFFEYKLYLLNKKE